MNFLKKLQQKPKKTKVLILWISSAIVMMLIISVWLFIFPRNTDKKDFSNDLEKTNLPSLFESFKQDFSALKQKFNADLKEVTTEVEKIDEE